jgi:hypothetical protein
MSTPNTYNNIVNHSRTQAYYLAGSMPISWSRRLKTHYPVDDSPLLTHILTPYFFKMNFKTILFMPCSPKLLSFLQVSLLQFSMHFYSCYTLCPSLSPRFIFYLQSILRRFFSISDYIASNETVIRNNELEMTRKEAVVA